jgi:hypothetical protein
MVTDAGVKIEGKIILLSKCPVPRNLPLRRYKPSRSWIKDVIQVDVTVMLLFGAEKAPLPLTPGTVLAFISKCMGDERAGVITGCHLRRRGHRPDSPGAQTPPRPPDSNLPASPPKPREPYSLNVAGRGLYN